MAIRYSGQVRISVTYRDQGDYRCTISSPGGRQTLFVNPPASGFGSGVAYDSPKAYDQTAHAALSFARESITESAGLTESGWHVARAKADAWKGWETSRSRGRSATRPRKGVGKRASAHRDTEAAKGNHHKPTQKKKYGTWYVSRSAWDRGNSVVAVNFATKAAAERWARSRKMPQFDTWQFKGSYR